MLAPHFSTLSIAKYEALFDDAVAGRAETRFVRRWGAEPGFVDALARRVRAVAGDGEPHVVFTAHSLPARIVDAGDPYRDELLETAALVADAAAIGDWSFSFQSESQTASRGSGRTSSTTSRRSPGRASPTCWPARSASSPTTSRSAGTSTSRRRSASRELGLGFARIEMPNAAPDLVDVLAGIVRRELAAVAA